MNKVKHHFVNEKLAVELFSVNNFDDFKKKLIKLSKTLPKINPCRWGRLSPEDNENKILGDGFELFVELLVNQLGIHSHIGLANYEVVNPDNDSGVDAYALNILSEMSAVQVKFSKNSTFEYSPTNSNIPSFINEAVFTLEGVDWTKKTKVNRLFFITSGKGIDWVGKKKWRDKIKVIGVNEIRQLVDNNILFWSACINEMKGINNE